MLARPVEVAERVAGVLRAPTQSCAQIENRLGVERLTSTSDTGRGKRGQNRRQKRNVRMAHGSKHCSAEAIRSYISSNGPPNRALRCRGRSRICLQDRNDDGHAPKPSRDIVASCRFYRGSPPRVLITSPSSVAVSGSNASMLLLLRTQRWP